MAATKAQIRAVRKYEAEKVDRVNCRFKRGTKERILETGYTINGFIVEAVMEKLERLEKEK